uniref:Uncharacterized protein n=1 Tax=Parascaris univalens TaxID=6257 RepID=A0A914ZSW9_PARUN
TETTGSSHRGFSHKARGVLLESVPLMPDKKVMEKHRNNVTSPAAPHRGFNGKAREVLLDRKKSQQRPDSSSSVRIKGGDKINSMA